MKRTKKRPNAPTKAVPGRVSPPAKDGDERTAPVKIKKSSRASRDRRDVGGRMGQSSGGTVHLGGDDGDKRGGYSSEGMRGAKREPYVGSRLGDWDETPRSPIAVSQERAQHASDDEQGGVGGKGQRNRPLEDDRRALAKVRPSPSPRSGAPAPKKHKRR